MRSAACRLAINAGVGRTASGLSRGESAVVTFRKVPLGGGEALLVDTKVSGFGQVIERGGSLRWRRGMIE